MEMTSIGVILKTILDSGMASKAMEKVATARSSNDKDKVIATYEDLFNQLIEENQQLKTIALAYKEEYDQMNLSEQDIEYLRNTAHRLIKLFIPEVSKENEKLLKEQHGQEEAAKLIREYEKEREQYETVIDLIQIDTLRTMQLLGYNYKKAIGEPLTSLTSQMLLNAAPDANPNSQAAINPNQNDSNNE